MSKSKSKSRSKSRSKSESRTKSKSRSGSIDESIPPVKKIIDEPLKNCHTSFFHNYNTIKTNNCSEVKRIFKSHIDKSNDTGYSRCVNYDEDKYFCSRFESLNSSDKRKDYRHWGIRFALNKNKGLDK